MTQPLVATYRVDFRYTVDGHQHHLRHYCDAQSTGLGSFNLADRTGAFTITLAGAVDRLATLLSPAYDAAKATFDLGVLQQFASMVWSPIETYIPTVAPTDGSPYVPAEQATFVARDVEFKTLRVQYMESGFTLGKHYNTLPPTSALLTLLNGYNSNSTNVADPYQWVRSRGDRLLAGASFVGFTTDLNDKLRRARGMV